jgi:hypothetical protein
MTIQSRTYVAMSVRTPAKKGQAFSRFTFASLRDYTTEPVTVTSISKFYVHFSDGGKMDRTTGSTKNKEGGIVSYQAA